MRLISGALRNSVVRFLLGSSGASPVVADGKLASRRQVRQLDELECHDGLAVMGAPEYDARDVLDKVKGRL